jgi:two-component system, cell cycle response regulator
MTQNSILLVEDSAVYRRIVGNHLRDWGYEVVVLRDGEAAWALLQQPHSPRLVLLDWVLPKMTGIEVCRRVRERQAGDSYTYTVLLTGKNTRNDLLHAMEAGADDYLAKPFDELALKARLLVGKRILSLQEELIVARENMRYSATHDSLTGLMNRKEVMDALGRELARSKREKSPLAIALIDIDLFKAINDELGHLFGDEALKEVAQRLRTGLRVYDSVGRYGGEEFLLVLPGCDLPGALLRTEQVRKAVANNNVRIMGKERQITISIGVAVSTGLGQVEAEVLLHQADTSLYQAKKKGKDRVEYIGSPNLTVRLDAPIALATLEATRSAT